MQTVGIVGLGALGVLFGQRLLENGADVRVIADEARAERYQKQGVICNGTPVHFRYETPEAAKPVDLMIFATKESGLRGAMETASGFIGENTLILSVLNGVSSEETIAARFGERNVIYCTAQGMDAVKVGNALTYAHAGMIVLGEKQPGGISPRVQQIADFLNTHGVTAQPVGDMVRRQWGKLMLNVGINQTVMVFEGDYGTVQKPGKPREIMLAAMREVQRAIPSATRSLTIGSGWRIRCRLRASRVCGRTAKRTERARSSYSRAQSSAVQRSSGWMCR